MNLKVCVYAISKNEEKFVKRWYESIKEADKIIVLDTGSNDNTVKYLKECGVDVYEKKYETWRFDDARNDSLSLVPKEYDICVCCDLDEVFEMGWKEKLINSWKDDTTRCRYTYNWSFKNGKPATTFLLNKIHKNGLYKWEHPVHEVLVPLQDEKEIEIKDIVLNHYPDSSKSRSSYLSLLELSVREDPKDDRNMHYLGREYMYYGMWEESIKTLKKHLKLKSATWKDERAASMRYIGRCYEHLNNNKMAKYYYKKAIKEAPYLREGYIEYGNILYKENKYLDSYLYLKQALEIKEKSDYYINEEYSWNSFIYDLLSICAFNLKLYSESLYYLEEAIKRDSNNERLLNNYMLVKSYVNKK